MNGKSVPGEVVCRPQVVAKEKRVKRLIKPGQFLIQVPFYSDAMASSNDEIVPGYS